MASSEIKIVKDGGIIMLLVCDSCWQDYVVYEGQLIEDDKVVGRFATNAEAVASIDPNCKYSLTVEYLPSIHDNY